MGLKPLRSTRPACGVLLTYLALAALGCGDSGADHADAGADASHARPDADASDARTPRDASDARVSSRNAPDASAPRDAPDASAPQDAPDARASRDTPEPNAPQAMPDANAPRDAGQMQEDAPAEDAAPGGGPNVEPPPVVEPMGVGDAEMPDSGSPPPDAAEPEPDSGPQAPPANESVYTMRVVALGLDAPWEITWGPDGRLWITERVGKKVIRVDPQTGSGTLALDVTDAYQDAGQDGVLGLALDPRLGRSMGGDYVYLAYTYDADAGAALDRRVKIARYTYNAGTETLGSPAVLLEGLPGSTDHNSGRVVYGPDDKLYYTIGDQGRNQFDRACLTNRAQDIPSQSEVDAKDWSAYQGKVLRLGLDGSIPTDNPVLAGVRSHIYSYGHRNVQGLAFAPDGKLYASEHGPKTDDEINLIQAGKNYGWPRVAGFKDDRAYIYGNWSASNPTPCSNLTFSDYGWPASVPELLESAWSSADFVPPIITFYTVNTGFNFIDPACSGNEFICWPTIAPSSLDVYAPGTTGLQSWGTSLLVPSLKKGSVFRIKLSADGQTTTGDAVELFKTTNRYRDLTIAPDKRTFYVVTDANGSTSGPTAGSTQQLDNRGAILEFHYAP